MTTDRDAKWRGRGSWQIAAPDIVLSKNRQRHLAVVRPRSIIRGVNFPVLRLLPVWVGDVWFFSDFCKKATA